MNKTDEMPVFMELTVRKREGAIEEPHKAGHVLWETGKWGREWGLVAGWFEI